MFNSYLFVISLSVSFQQCSIHMFIYSLLIPEGHKGEIVVIRKSGRTWHKIAIRFSFPSVKSIQVSPHSTNAQYSYFVCHRPCIILTLNIVSKQKSSVCPFEKFVACILRMTSCNLAGLLASFGRNLLSASSTLKMETASTPVSLVTVYKMPRHRIQKSL